MNKNMSKLARFGLAVGIMRLLNRRRESRVRRLFRRLGPQRSFTARTTRQLSMLARRSSKRLGPQMRTLPLIGRRFGSRTPARRMMQNLPLVAGLSLPALSALSLPALSLRNMSWMPGRRASVVAQQDGRVMMVLMAPKAGMTRVVSLARGQRRLPMLGLGAALALAGLFVFGRQVRSRYSGATMLAEPEPYGSMGYRQAGVSSTTGAPMAGTMRTERRPEAERRTGAAAGHEDWVILCREFSQANRDRPVNVEVQEAGGNTRALAHEVPLLGVELAAEGVQIMLGETMDNRMEHDIPDPVGLHPIAGENGGQAGLVIHGGDGSTTTLRLA